jgi:hypothetical protein
MSTREQTVHVPPGEADSSIGLSGRYERKAAATAELRRRQGVIAAFAALAALVGLVEVARAAFSAPVKLASSHANSPSVASDADGDAIAIWRREVGSNWRIQARTVSADGALGPIQTLSGPDVDASSPRVASDAGGDAIAVWGTSNYRIQARTISAAGVLGPIRTLSAAGQPAIGAEVASDADGDAVAVWERSDGLDWRAQARTISAAGVLGPIRTLSRSGGSAAGALIASGADGDALAVWGRSDGSNHRVQARSISPPGVLGPIRTLSRAGDRASAAGIASAANGDAIAIWRRFDSATSNRVQARTISAAGALGPIQTLSAAGESDFPPQIASDADGDAVAVWGFRGYRIQARTISSAGVLGPIEVLSDPDGTPTVLPEVASDGNGGAIAVWLGHDGSHYRIQARTISAASTLGPIQTLSPAGKDASAPEIAVDADGDAIAVWARLIFGAAETDVQASQGP